MNRFKTFFKEETNQWGTIVDGSILESANPVLMHNDITDKIVSTWGYHAYDGKRELTMNDFKLVEVEITIIPTPVIPAVNESDEQTN